MIEPQQPDPLRDDRTAVPTAFHRLLEDELEAGVEHHEHKQRKVENWVRGSQESRLHLLHELDNPTIFHDRRVQVKGLFVFLYN